MRRGEPGHWRLVSRGAWLSSRWRPVVTLGAGQPRDRAGRYCTR